MPVIHDKRVAEPSPELTFLRGFFSRFDLLQVIPMLVLLAYGILFVYGTGQQIGGIIAEVFWKRHILWIVIGFVIWLILSLTDYRKIGFLFALLYPCSLMSLVVVLLSGVSRFGARRWLTIAGVSIQPGEFAKLITMIFCAWILSRKHFEINKFRNMCLIFLIMALPLGLILKQPNLSTALTLGFCAAAMIFTARLKWKWILLLLLTLAIAAPVAYSSLRPYHRARIMVFLNPQLDPLDKGWNQRQAELAAGSGGLWGKGFMCGTQNLYGYLPQTVTNSDFIFSVIAEETGFLGSLFLLLMYALLLFSVFRCALLATDPFGLYLCTGTGVMIAIHTIVNIGMTLRLMPVTGLPLPLVSYGGSFMLVSFAALGLVQSVYAHQTRNPGDSD